MRDKENRLIFEETFETILEDVLTNMSINSRQRIIQQNDIRVATE